MWGLFAAIGDKYFAIAKQVANKNKSIVELSLYTKAFFKVFLLNKTNFQRPTGCMYFGAYKASTNGLGSFLIDNWKMTSEQLSLVVLDFQWVAKLAWKERRTLDKPNFKMFMNMFLMTNFLMVFKPPIWLWICGDKEMELMACHLMEHVMFTGNYMIKYSTYEPAKFKRLEDLLATNKNTRALIS